MKDIACESEEGSRWNIIFKKNYFKEKLIKIKMYTKYKLAINIK